MSPKVANDDTPAPVERQVRQISTDFRLIREEGAPRPDTTVVLVGPRDGPNDDLITALVDASVQVLHVEAPGSLFQVLDALFYIDAVIFAVDVSRLTVAAFTEALKDYARKPDLFALVTNAIDGAWLSRLGVISIPKWADWKNIRTSILQERERPEE
jgi:hypothetical protein